MSTLKIEDNEIVAKGKFYKKTIYWILMFS
jgi:hypothetical protein